MNQMSRSKANGEPRREKRTLLRPARRWLHPQSRLQWPLGSELDARPCRHRLLAYVIEERHCPADFVPARLTVDMFRLPDIHTPIEVTTKLIRDGKRIKLVEADFFSGGTHMARASCQLLLKTENAPGNVWSPKNWDAPLPDTIPRRPIPGSA
jgi:hypothetical protein